MIHIYTGEGKGKTTAALGLAIRAAGADKRVFIAQFLKGRQYSELNSLKKLKNITVQQFGTICFVRKTPRPKDIMLAEEGLVKARKIIQSKRFDVVILDEINFVIHLKLLNIEKIIEIIKSVPKNIELILTGRYASEQLIKLADYVTDMKEIKHPFRKKITGRKGIEF
jgi:cob(I)alamin adenosyltransferase